MTRALTLGLVVFVLALWRSLADGIGLTDESWFLQVVARIRGGDVLYRDVFLGVTPLSAWVTAGVTLLVGIEIVAVKIVTNACFAATTVLSGRLAKEAGLSSGASVVVMAAMFIWARPYNNPPYTPMAMAFFTAALVVSLAAAKAGGRAAPAWRGWLGAGTLAGLSFASKQNVGLLALACVGAGVIAAGGADWLRLRTRAGWATAGFGAVVLVVLVPVAVSGGLPALWDYGFSGKGAYLDIGSVSYLGSLRETFAALSGVSSASGLSSALHGLVTVLPLAVLLAAVAASKRLDRFDWLLIVFAAATTLSALPRWDRFHMAYAVPVHLVAIGRIAPRLSVRWPGPALRRATPWAVVGLAVVVAARPLVTVGRSGSTPLDMVHFRGARVRSDRAAGLRADAAALRSAAGGRPVFVVTRDAGFWYLASGTRNPTPFDIPARTATGTNGIPMLLDQLHEGKLDLVCLDDGPPDAQSLVEVEAYVREHYQTGADLGPCTMFTAPADGVVRKRQRS